VWSAAAIWLARLHDLTPVPDGEPLLRYDREYYGRWMERALRIAPDAGLEPLGRVHTRAIARLAAARPEPVHGDYYPANILVRSGAAPEICPVDFELFGSGAGVLDLAALVTGLPPARAGELVEAYRSHRREPIARAELDELVLCARLHLAVRWLGWLEGWSAPDHQRFDWAAEARAAAAALEGVL
jgi:Ser/Thr protein kinase RdoA (MazF antagonist)